MSTLTSIVSCFVMILSSYLTILAVGQDDTCTMTTSSKCICEFGDKTKIDLTPIANNDGTPRFDYKASPSQGDYEYAYNPCFLFSDGTDCTGVAACQRSIDNKYHFNIGSVDSASFSPAGDLITYTGSDQRTTKVKLICDQSVSAEKSQYAVTGETSKNPSVYELSIKSCQVCKGGCSGQSNNSLSFGSILCILFVVLLFVYLVGGVLFNRYARGASGKEVISNVSFWEEFPLLVKDGFLFVASCVKKDSTYDSI